MDIRVQMDLQGLGVRMARNVKVEQVAIRKTPVIHLFAKHRNYK